MGVICDLVSISSFTYICDLLHRNNCRFTTEQLLRDHSHPRAKYLNLTTFDNKLRRRYLAFGWHRYGIMEPIYYLDTFTCWHFTSITNWNNKMITTIVFCCVHYPHTAWHGPIMHPVLRLVIDNAASSVTLISLERDMIWYSCPCLRINKHTHTQQYLPWCMSV